MKDDYLWDKSGDDPEIKRLEDVLAVFQYKETAAPALQTAKILAFPERSKRREYSFAYAMAACVTIAIVMGIWSQISRGVETETDLARTTPQNNTESTNEQIVKNVDSLTIDEIQKADPPVGPAPVKIRAGVTPVRHARTIVRKSGKANPTVTLTSEEKFAYGQLILALSITGSKLKIVQDKVNGVEEGKTNVKENNR